MIPGYFVFLGAILSLSGSLNYAINTLKGKTKPNRVTWFLWALAPLIAFAAQISQGVGITVLMTFMVGFGPLLIFISSFFNKKASWKLTKFDIVCGVLSLLGLVIWFITREANYAIAIAIIADLLAALPTIVKSYKFPETESSLVYLFASINATIALLVINNWTFEYYAFPLYILLLCLPLYFMIKFKIGPKISSQKS